VKRFFRSAGCLTYQYLSKSFDFATICCANAKCIFRIPPFPFGCGFAASRCIAGCQPANHPNDNSRESVELLDTTGRCNLEGLPTGSRRYSRLGNLRYENPRGRLYTGRCELPGLLGFVAISVGFLLLSTAAFAQPAGPRIGYVYPAGGRQGISFQVKVGGQYLDGVTNVYVSGPGVRATVLEHVKPLTPQQANALREKLRELQQKRQAALRARRRGAAPNSTNTWTAADQRTFEEIRKRLATFQRRPANPAIAETATLQVALAADAPPGQRELRVGSRLGISNPLVFCVGQLPEFRKRESAPNNASPPNRRPRNAQPQATPPVETVITIPAIVNGQILPGGVDRYRFRARQGQQLVCAVSARELIPYLADAVPGWFQATLTLYDSTGRELAYDDDFRFHPDPVLYYRIPNDGEYVVEIKDAIFRGREDFVYRVEIGELPFITGIFPLGTETGTQAEVAVKGWNLPAPNLEVNEASNPPGLYSVSETRQKLLSNPVPFAVDDLPEVVEQEPNDLATSPQALRLPTIVNGRIDRPGDWDVFRFEGRAGQNLVAEVYARRLDSPLDSVLKLTDAAGRQLAFNDDHEDKGSGLNTHHADSYLSATLPADGIYYLQLGDAQRHGGADYAYRLRVSEPRPDFALRVVPSNINVRPGMSIPLTVYALRKDGFTNVISLALSDAPTGFSLSGASVPAGQERVRITLTAPRTFLDEPVSLSMEGQAIVQGKPIVRMAVPAEDMMQAFAYRHLVPAQQLKVAMVGAGRFAGRGVPLGLEDQKPVKIPVGGIARVFVSGPPAALAGRLQLELSEPPDGLAIKDTIPVRGGAEIVFRADTDNAKPGLKGNLIVNIFASVRPAADQKTKKRTNQRRIALGTLPAIPFEIMGN